MSTLQARSTDRIEDVFPELSAFVHEEVGIVLPPSKIELVRSRLQRRLRETGHADFAAYFGWVTTAEARDERVRMLDLLTTNKTHFYREGSHFEHLRTALSGPPFLDGEVRIWSAGCSTGEEPYTLSAVLADARPGDTRYRILATDLSRRVLDAARKGEYVPRQAQEVPEALRQRLFGKGGSDGVLRVRDETRRPVAFARLNLLAEWPMKRPFHAIFCRNVMIYFDAATREHLVRRFTRHLAPGGLLFVGHSESLSGLDHDLRYVRPAIYRR